MSLIAIRRTFHDENGTPFEAWCARPEDIIIGKLLAWDEGRSAKHPNDIYAMLLFSFSGFGDEQLDLDYIAARAVAISAETGVLWRDLVARARQESEQYRR